MMRDDAWDHFKRGVKSLPRKTRLPIKTVLKKTSIADKRSAIASPETSTAATERATPGDPDLLRRLQRGETRIEAKLDLHHMTEAAAFRAVEDFLAAMRRAGKRHLLIVTGKGAVLHQAVPRWLTLGPLANGVRFCAEAAPKHGGAGAVYAVMKIARTSTVPPTR